MCARAGVPPASALEAGARRRRRPLRDCRRLLRSGARVGGLDHRLCPRHRRRRGAHNYINSYGFALLSKFSKHETLRGEEKCISFFRPLRSQASTAEFSRAGIKLCGETRNAFFGTAIYTYLRMKLRARCKYSCSSSGDLGADRLLALGWQ